MESSLPQRRVRPEIIKKKLPGVWKSTKQPCFLAQALKRPDVDSSPRGKGYVEQFRQKLGTSRLVLSNSNVHRNYLGLVLTCKLWFSGPPFLISSRVMPCHWAMDCTLTGNYYRLPDLSGPWQPMTLQIEPSLLWIQLCLGTQACSTKCVCVTDLGERQ